MRLKEVALRSRPFVSVVMSVFNGERYLAEAVESILDQSFRDFEFIVIDDGSTDGSGRILDSYARRDARIRVFRQANLGLVDALNRGCELAEGQYIARMDADDISVHDRLSWQVQFMEQHPEVGVVGGAIQRIDASGKALEIKWYAPDDRNIKAALFRSSSELAHPAVLLRKKVLLSAGGYRVAFVDAEDYDLWLRISECSQLANLDRVVLKYRVHPTQVSRRKLKQQALSVLAARALASARRNGHAERLSWVGEVTPETLVSLGVREVTQQSFVASAHLFWIKCLVRWGNYPDALGLADEVYRISRTVCLERWVLSDTKLAIARIYWKQNKFLRSVCAAAAAVIVRPIILGRPLNLLLRRVRRSLKAHGRHIPAAIN